MKQWGITILQVAALIWGASALTSSVDTLKKEVASLNTSVTKLDERVEKLMITTTKLETRVDILVPNDNTRVRTK